MILVILVSLICHSQDVKYVLESSGEAKSCTSASLLSSSSLSELSSEVSVWLSNKPLLNAFLSSSIGHFQKYQKTICLSPQILHKHCFGFFLGPF